MAVLTDANLTSLEHDSNVIQNQNNDWKKLTQELKHLIQEEEVGRAFSTEYEKGKKICNKLIKLADNLVSMRSDIDEICRTCKVYVTNHRRANQGGED